MKENVSDPKLIAYCGLYCGSCRKYLNGKCHGCHENAKASWCNVRSCNIESGYKSCADCTDFPDPKECKKFNNFISKIIGIMLKSDRSACLAMIKERGYEEFAGFMADHKLQTIRR